MGVGAKMVLGRTLPPDDRATFLRASTSTRRVAARTVRLSIDFMMENYESSTVLHKRLESDERLTKKRH